MPMAQQPLTGVRFPLGLAGEDTSEIGNMPFEIPCHSTKVRLQQKSHEAYKNPPLLLAGVLTSKINDGMRSQVLSLPSDARDDKNFYV
jgi:hypothetical protein